MRSGKQNIALPRRMNDNQTGREYYEWIEYRSKNEMPVDEISTSLKTVIAENIEME